MPKIRLGVVKALAPPMKKPISVKKPRGKIPNISSRVGSPNTPRSIPKIPQSSNDSEFDRLRRIHLKSASKNLKQSGRLDTPKR